MSFAKAIASFKLKADVPNSLFDDEKTLELEEVIREQRAHAKERRLMSDKDKASSAAAEEELSEEEQVKAAQAVVDAAICCQGLFCQGLGSDAGITEETRAFLVDAVMRDPSLTPRLFTEDFRNFMRF